jgi:hypothetical protein
LTVVADLFALGSTGQPADMAAQGREEEEMKKILQVAALSPAARWRSKQRLRMLPERLDGGEKKTVEGVSRAVPPACPRLCLAEAQAVYDGGSL